MAMERVSAGFTRRGDRHGHPEGQGSRPPSRALRQQQRRRRRRKWRAAVGSSSESDLLLAAASHPKCRLTYTCQLAIEISDPTVREERASCGVGSVTNAGGMLANCR